MSWRDDADPQVLDELDELLDVAVRAAQQKLDAAGAFYPFGIALEGPGVTRTVTPEVRTGPREVAGVAQVLDACWTSLQAEADSVAAVAVASDVGGPDGDAIAVALEHRNGPSIEVFLPYASQGKTNGKKPAQKHLYGELQATPGRRRVWV